MPLTKRSKAYIMAAKHLQVGVFPVSTDDPDGGVPLASPAGSSVSVHEVVCKFGEEGMEGCKRFYPGLSEQQILDCICFAGRLLEWLEAGTP